MSAVERYIWSMVCFGDAQGQRVSSRRVVASPRSMSSYVTALQNRNVICMAYGALRDEGCAPAAASVQFASLHGHPLL